MTGATDGVCSTGTSLRSAVLLAILGVVNGCASAASGPPPRSEVGESREPAEGRRRWAAADGTLSLDLAWRLPMDGNVTSTPLVDGGKLYSADWKGNVFALDAATGRTLWKRAVGHPNDAWPWHGFSGTGALDADCVYHASTEGVAYAINRRTGDVVWQRQVARNPNSGNCGRLLARGGMLFVGLSSVEEGLALQPGFEPTAIGEVVALDLRDGHEVWRRALTEPPHNGVGVWSGFDLDDATGTLYFTTGNNYTGEGTPLSDSVVAVDARTGALLWSRQATQGDVWNMAQPLGPDFDFGARPQLFQATIEGRARDLVGAGQKSGAFFAWDRRTGDLVWRTQVTQGDIAGGIMASASVASGRIYLYSNNTFAAKEPEKHPMDVVALDAASGAVLWRTPNAQPAATTGGTLAGGVYFVPSYDGRVRGYSAADGRLLWTSGRHASVGTSLTAEDGMLYFGTSVPKDLGGDGGPPELVAYRAP